jgi:ribosomal protein S18 acetylase RimI-like enzyme
MATFTTRLYQSKSDYLLMTSLLAEWLAVHGPPAYVTSGEMDWWRTRAIGKGTLTNTRMWFDSAGKLASFAWMKGNNLDLLSHPVRRAAEQEVIAWAEEKVRALPADEEGLQRLNTWCLTHDTSRHTLLTRLEYQRTDDFYNFYYCSLEEPLPQPPLPPGYSLRPLKGTQEFQARVDLHRAAFEPSSFTLYKFRQMIHFPSYKPELDLVIEAPGGALAAFCLIWWDERNQHGAIEPMGVHPNYRGMGLARAVVGGALDVLRKRGAKSASVYCWHEDAAANHVYELSGLRALDRAYRWEKAV